MDFKIGDIFYRFNTKMQLIVVADGGYYPITDYRLQNYEQTLPIKLTQQILEEVCGFILQPNGIYIYRNGNSNIEIKETLDVSGFCCCKQSILYLNDLQHIFMDKFNMQLPINIDRLKSILFKKDKQYNS